MQGLDYASLWSKGKMLIDRAVVSRDADEDADFYLWMALALEVLGKAHLAKMNPALIADHPDTLFALCTNQACKDPKTIGAKMVFERCARTVKGFRAVENFCHLLAKERNAHLHSGELPFATSKPDAWESECWKVVDLLAVAQGESLDALLGEEEADAVRTLIADHNKAFVLRIQRRVQNCANRFLQLPAHERRLKQEAAKLGRRASEHSLSCELVDCPACESAGVVEGEEVEESGPFSHDGDIDDEWSTKYVTKTFAASEFACSACGLELKSVEEMEVVDGLPVTFEKEAPYDYDGWDDYQDE